MGDSPVPKLSILWRVKNSIFEARDGQQNKWVSMVSQWFRFSSFPWAQLRICAITVRKAVSQRTHPGYPDPGRLTSVYAVRSRGSGWERPNRRSRTPHSGPSTGHQRVASLPWGEWKLRWETLGAEDLGSEIRHAEELGSIFDFGVDSGLSERVNTEVQFSDMFWEVLKKTKDIRSASNWKTHNTARYSVYFSNGQIWSNCLSNSIYAPLGGNIPSTCQKNTGPANEKDLCVYPPRLHLYNMNIMFCIYEMTKPGGHFTKLYFCIFRRLSNIMMACSIHI